MLFYVYRQSWLFIMLGCLGKVLIILISLSIRDLVIELVALDLLITLMAYFYSGLFYLDPRYT